METIEISDNLALQCPTCSNLIAHEDKFCGQCGVEVVMAKQAKNEDIFTALTPTLIYYFVTLLLLAFYKLTSIFPEGLKGLIVVSVIDIAIVVIFCLYYFKELKSLFTIPGFDIKVLVQIIGGAVVAGIAISFIADLINISIFEEVYYNPLMFEDIPFPFLWIVLTTCIQPAIFEEVAFRGYLFNNLQTVTSTRNAIYISSVLFGVIHLSFISLLWLIPIGLILAALRSRYNTLWYGIIAHFVYNLTISVVEYIDFHQI